MLHTVKSKIIWGSAFLFLLMVLAGAASIYFFNNMRRQSAGLLKANYESVAYGQEMGYALDSMAAGRQVYADTFRHYLQLQSANITEKGEEHATSRLALYFTSTPQGLANDTLRKYLRQVVDLNMHAIRRKAATAEAAAEDATKILVTILTIILLVGITFVYNFPRILVTPIQKLTAAIQEIGRKNYRHRIHLDSRDEFGQLAGAFNEMADRLEYFESSSLKKILFEKSRAEAVINSLKDASIGVDNKGVVLFANNQALGLLGLKPENFVGANVQDLVKVNDLFRFLWEEESNMPFKIVLEAHENYFTKEVIEVTQEGAVNKVIVLHNITSFKELDAAKTTFIATISHELKTPLASSDFALKLLTDNRVSDLSQAQKDIVNGLQRDNQRMLRILSELLNMAQVEAGKIILNIAPADPLQICAAAATAVQNAAQEKSILLNKHFQNGLPPVKADQEKTAWVLQNLLSNAFKYAPQNGTVRLELSEKNGQIHFSVHDQGPGIAPEYLTRVFDRFFKVPGGENGTGLGLFICKEIIEAQQGQIWVESDFGNGSTFRFCLPVA